MNADFWTPDVLGFQLAKKVGPKWEISNHFFCSGFCCRPSQCWVLCYQSSFSWPVVVPGASEGSFWKVTHSIASAPRWGSWPFGWRQQPRASNCGWIQLYRSWGPIWSLSCRISVWFVSIPRRLLRYITISFGSENFTNRFCDASILVHSIFSGVDVRGQLWVDSHDVPWANSQRKTLVETASSAGRFECFVCFVFRI